MAAGKNSGKFARSAALRGLVQHGARRSRWLNAAAAQPSYDDVGDRPCAPVYATSVEQLVVGLAPVMGWGRVPREQGERA